MVSVSALQYFPKVGYFWKKKSRGLASAKRDYRRNTLVTNNYCCNHYLDAVTIFSLNWEIFGVSSTRKMDDLDSSG
jgi:hypothetical protein